MKDGLWTKIRFKPYSKVLKIDVVDSTLCKLQIPDKKGDETNQTGWQSLKNISGLLYIEKDVVFKYKSKNLATL